MADGYCHIVRVDDDVDVSIALILSPSQDPAPRPFLLDSRRKLFPSIVVLVVSSSGNKKITLMVSSASRCHGIT